MGITGLLPFLEKASEKTNLRNLEPTTINNKRHFITVAVDAYCWLHKGAFACSELLARGENTDIHIQYCLKYVNMLLRHGIKPILVFDGRHLPAKALTEKKRRENRKIAKARAAELLRLGKIDEARSQFRRCVDITHEMALQLIKECRTRNVDCIVAPYEADGELAYLNLIGIADYVITEDSDLILFGCKKILFKLDLSGSCTLVEASKLFIAMGCRLEKFSFDKFRFMCVMSGCDYLDSMPGIGLAKSCKFVLKSDDSDIKRALTKIPAYLNMRHLEITEEYKENFLKAIATFRHMIVYDPIKRQLINLTDPTVVGTDKQYCSNAGTFFNNKEAFQLALGNLDPFSNKQLDNWLPPPQSKSPIESVVDKKNKKIKICNYPSIWQINYFDNVSLKSEKIKMNIETKEKSLNSFRPSLSIMPNEFDDQPPPEPLTEQEIKANTDDLLLIYGNVYSPELPAFKKQKFNSPEPTSTTNEADEAISLLTTPPKRQTNPFGIKRSPSSPLTSPTKITKDNNSLLKQCSPVKRNSRHSDTTSPIKKSFLNKFRTNRSKVLDSKQVVLSRFFPQNRSLITGDNTAGATTKTDNNFDMITGKCSLQSNAIELLTTDDDDDDDDDDHMRGANLSNNKKCLIPSIYDELTTSENDSDDRDQLLLLKVTNGKMRRSLFSTNAKVEQTDDNDDDDVEDVENDCDKIEISSESSQSLVDFNTFKYKNGIKKNNLISKTLKPQCRQPGLSKTAKSKVGKSTLTENSTQSRLSMFGFKKKSL